MTSVIKLSVVMPSVVIPSVVMPNIITVSVTQPSAVISCVIKLNVVAQCKHNATCCDYPGLNEAHSHLNREKNNKTQAQIRERA